MESKVVAKYLEFGKVDGAIFGINFLNMLLVLSCHSYIYHFPLDSPHWVIKLNCTNLITYVCIFTRSFWVTRVFKILHATSHISTCHVLLTTLSKKNQQLHIPYVVSIGDCTHVGSATASFKGLGNICTGELHQSNSRCFGRGSTSTSFGPGNSFQEARTPQTKQQK